MIHRAEVWRGLATVAIVLGVVGFLNYLATPNFAPPPARSKSERVRSDLRSLATGLGNYFQDHGAYPPSSLDIARTPMQSFYISHPKGDWNRPTFMHHLTTPVAYVSGLFPDPFAEERGRAFHYYAHPSGQGWIIWSNGADEKSQLNWKVYDPTVPQPSVELLTGAGPSGAFTYDPSNGTVSAGDLWRVKQ